MDLSRIEKLYSDNLDRFGIDSRSVGWNSKESQELRFRKLMEIIQTNENNISINELGCGYGELFKFCIEKEYPVSEYYGYDISQKMIDMAQDYINDHRVKLFHASRIITIADYTLTSGIFNVKFDNSLDSWEDLIKNTLIHMFTFSKKGIAFNLLTKFVDFEVPDLYYADPCYFFDFCKTHLSKKVSLLHDYDLYEWTIIVRK